jgi:hypothetical protein
MTCTDAQQTFNVQLIPASEAAPGGSSYSAYETDESTITVYTSAALTLNCGEPPEPPTPVDGTEDPTDDDDATATPVAQDLPDTGTGGASGASTGIWMLIAALGVLASASLGAAAWQRARDQ